MNLKLLKCRIIFVMLCFFFIMIWYPADIKAQNCTYEVNLVDPSTGAVVKRTSDVAIGKLNRQPFYVKTQCIGKNKYLKIRYYCYDNFFISDKHPMKLTFMDDTSIDLIPRSNDDQQESINISKISTMLIYFIDENQLNKMMSEPIKKIEFQSSQGDFVDFDVRERFRSTIQQLLDCVKI